MNSNNITPNSNSVRKKAVRRFNVIDFFVIVIILLVVAVLVYTLSPWSHIKKFWSTNEVTFNYAVELRGVDAKYIDLIKEGDAVLNSVTKESLGNVTSIENVNKSKTLNYTVNPESGVAEGVLVESANLYDITVHITTTAEYEKNVGYTVNGCRVAVGEELFFRFPNFEKSGYCVAIDTKS